MFLGEYQHTLDPKGRVILPSAFREELGEGVVMTVGLDNCLNIHPHAHWQQVIDNLRQLRATDSRERAYARVVTASAHPDQLDRQGRITIPARLRGFASLTKDVTVVGRDQHVELWDSGRWERYRAEAWEAFANTEHAFDMGGL